MGSNIPFRLGNWADCSLKGFDFVTFRFRHIFSSHLVWFFGSLTSWCLCPSLPHTALPRFPLVRNPSPVEERRLSQALPHAIAQPGKLRRRVCQMAGYPYVVIRSFSNQIARSEERRVGKECRSRW